MVAPEREPLRGEVEIDEFFLGGYEEGLKGSRQRGKKALCGVAIEVRGRGSGRIRLAVLPDASKASLNAFAHATTERRAIINTDGWKGYNGLSTLGYDTVAAASSASPGSSCSRARIGPSQTSRRGFTAPTAASATLTCSAISTNTPSATTAAAPRWPPFRPCSGSGRCTRPPPTARSPDEISQQPEPTGYALPR